MTPLLLLHHQPHKRCCHTRIKGSGPAMTVAVGAVESAGPLGLRYGERKRTEPPLAAAEQEDARSTRALGQQSITRSSKQCSDESCSPKIIRTYCRLLQISVKLKALECVIADVLAVRQESKSSRMLNWQQGCNHGGQQEGIDTSSDSQPYMLYTHGLCWV